jgi:RHS repeat-associated protein
MGLKTSDKIISGPMPTPAANRRAVNTFNAADRLTSAQVTEGTQGTNTITETFLYDGCGALTNQSSASVPLATYSYDLAQRMTTATASNLTLSASYDALGNRVNTTVNGATSLWVIDHTDPLKRPLMETTTNGTPVRYYIWGAGRLLAMIDADGTTRYAHSDEQGSVVALTDTNGAVLFTASYGPYGEPWGTTGTNATPFGWLGGHGVFHADGHSLYLTRHRAYDTTMKRFLSSDPIGLGGGANLYGYALGNPLSYIDPMGLGAEASAWSKTKKWLSSTASDIANDRNLWDALAYTPLGVEYQLAEGAVLGLAATVVKGSKIVGNGVRYLEGLVTKGAASADDLLLHARKYLGNSKLIIEKPANGSDLIIRTADKTKSIRFDLSNPHGLDPHVNVEAWKPRNLFPGDRTMLPDSSVVPEGNLHLFPKTE